MKRYYTKAGEGSKKQPMLNRIYEPNNLIDLQKYIEQVISASGLAFATSGSGTPTSTPTRVGQSYIDEMSGNVFISNGVGNASNWIQINNVEPLIVDRYEEIFSEPTIQINNTDVFASALSGTTSTLDLGDYLITLSYNWNFENTSSDIETNLIFDSVSLGGTGDSLIHKQEPKDSEGGTGNGTSSTQIFTYSAQFQVTVSESGPKTFDLQFRSDLNLETASLWNIVFKIQSINQLDPYNPLIAPDTSGLVPNITGVAPSALAALTPGTPGDVIELDGSTFNMTFDYEVSGFRGTQANPIWIFGNGSTFSGKSLELFDNEWCYFKDINIIDSDVNGLQVQQSQDCIYENFTITNSGLNGAFIAGTPTDPNARLAFFNFNINTWSGSDGFSFHADGSENNNESNFVVVNLTCQNDIDTGEDGLDITSGQNFHIHNYNGTDARIHVAHGVRNVYLDTITHNFDPTSVRNSSIEFRNTDGDVWVANTTGNGEIDLGTTVSPRTNEDANTTLGSYITYELKLWNNKLTGGIHNNTSGSGTILTYMTFNEINNILHTGFYRWPNT